MSAKPTSYQKGKKILPDYEILDPKDPDNVVQSGGCCTCEYGAGSACTAENPNGMASLAASWVGGAYASGGNR